MPAENPTQNPAQSVHAESRFDSQSATVSHEQTPVFPEFASPREIVRMCSVGDTGLDPVVKSSGNTEVDNKGGTECGTVSAQSGELFRVFDSWASLTADDRRRILAIVARRLA